MVIGAIFGGFSGYKIGKAKGASGWKMFGYIFGGAAIGTLASHLGASTFSSAMSGATSAGMGGFSAGANASLLSGLASGGITGGGLAALQGQNVNGILSSATIGAWMGGISGAIVGGVYNGIDAKLHNGNFWNGDGYEDYFLLKEPYFGEFKGGRVDYSAESIVKSIDENNFYNDQRMDFVLRDEPEIYRGKFVLGKQSWNGDIKRSTITINKMAFRHKELLDLTIGHEIMHHKFDVYYHIFKGLSTRHIDHFTSSFMQDYICYNWNHEWYMSHGLNRVTSTFKVDIDYRYIINSPVTDPFPF